MNCQQIQLLLHAHHDGELDAANTIEVDRHLADCPHCFARTRNLGVMRVLLRDDALRHRTPVDARRHIQDAVANAARAERDLASGHFKKWAIGMAAALLVSASLAVFWRTPGAENQLLAEVTSSHVRSLMVAHLTDVASSDQHTVKPWFEGKLDYAPPVKDLRDAGFPLVGGRLDYLAGRPVAALVYARQKHFINLFVWPAGKEGSVTTLRRAERSGFHVVHWTSKEMSYWAVSDLNEKELSDFGQLLSGG